MAKDTMVMDTTALHTLPQQVDAELRSILNNDMYTAWREDNPDGDILDWLMESPEFVMHCCACNDTDSESWRAWLDFWNRFTNENRQMERSAHRDRVLEMERSVHRDRVLGAAQKGDRADE